MRMPWHAARGLQTPINNHSNKRTHDLPRHEDTNRELCDHATVLSKVPEQTLVVMDQPSLIIVSRRPPTEMRDQRSRDDAHLPPCTCDPPAPVGLFEVHEESLIQTTDAVFHFPAHN